MSSLPTADSSPVEPLPQGWRIAGTLLILAGPIIASMVSRTAMSFVDFVMVSRLGTEAQAAITASGILLFCLIGFGIGLTSVTNALVAHAMGKGTFGDCSAYTWQGIYLSLIYGLLLLPLWFAVPSLFAWIGHAPQVQQMEVTYFQICLLGMAPGLACHAVSHFFTGLHRPGIGLWAALAGNVFNFVGNYALIFGHFGFPALGIAGAAWCTNLGTLLQLAILLGCFFTKRYRQQYQTTRTWRWDWPRMIHIVKMGIAPGLQFLGDILSFAIFTNVLIGRFGTQQLAANNVCFKLLEMSFMPTVGLGVAVTASVGKAMGQKRPDHARKVVRWGMLFGMGYMGLIGLLYLWIPRSLAGFFSDDPQVIDWVVKLLVFCAVFQIFDAMGITFLSALRGAGDNVVPALLFVGSSMLVLLGGGFLIAHLQPQWQSVGPWAMATAHITLVGLLLGGRFWHGAWEKIDLSLKREDELPSAQA